MIDNVRNVRPYRASTTAGPVVIVSITYNDAMELLVNLGYDVLELRGMVPVQHPHAWHNVISPAWWRVQYERIQNGICACGDHDCKWTETRREDH